MKRLLLVFFVLFAYAYAVTSVSNKVTWETGAYDNNTKIDKTLSIDGAKRLDVKIKGSTEFDYDFVYVYSESGKLIQKLSGDIDADFTVEGSSVKIELISDDEVTDSGVTVTVSKLETDSTSLWKTGEYNNNSNLLKELYINNAKRVDVRITGSTELNCDFVLVYNENGKLVQKLSGEIDADFTVEGSSVSIKLISDDSATDSGVSVAISKTSKNKITFWETGRYKNNSNLLKELYIDNAKSLKVKISGKVEEDYDFVYVYSNRGDLIKKFSGDINSEFDVNGSSVVVKLVSDEAESAKGLVVTVSDLNSTDGYEVSLLGTISDLPNYTLYSFAVNSSENRVYFGNSYLGLYVYNINDAKNPFLESNYDKFEIYKFDLKGDTKAYIATHPPVISHHTHSDIMELNITDSSNIHNIRKVSRVGGFVKDLRISYNQKYLYTVSRGGSIAGPSHYYLRKLDLNSNQNVYYVRHGKYNPMRQLALTHSGNYMLLYITAYDKSYNGKSEIEIYDNQTGKKLYTIDNIDSDIHKMVTTKDDKKLFVATDQGLKIYDISDIKNIKKLVTYHMDSIVKDIALSNDETKVYVANSTEGLKVLDISDIYSIKKIGQYKTSSDAVRVSVSKDDKKVYLLDKDRNFLILKLDNKQK